MIFWYIVLGCLGWIVAGMLAGLALGHHFHIRSLESARSQGSRPAAVLTPAPDMEERAIKAEKEALISSFQHGLEQEARAMGKQVSPERLREEAVRLAEEVSKYGAEV